MGNRQCKHCGSMSTRKNGIRDGCQRYFCTNCSREFREPISEENRILVIPDTHAPFMREDFPVFLKEIYDKYECNHVIHLGDEIDFHASSRHSTDPDGYSAGEELRRAVEQLKILANMFPNMDVVFGNHSRIPARVAKENGISSYMIKPLKQVYLELGVQCEGWTFAESFEYDGVKYVHGEGRQAKTRMTQDGISIVQGHWHSRSGLDWLVNKYQCNFAMQLGSGIDDKAYAFYYAKDFARSITNCGVVLDGGRLPIIETMRR